MAKIKETVSEKIKMISPSISHEESTSVEHQSSDETEIITQLKEKFAASEKRSQKVQILTLLPKSWSIQKIQAEFSTTTYMARQAKKLVKEQGILALPNTRKTNFPQETIDEVVLFYKSEEVSRVMPGKNDYKTVLKNGKRVREQKYLVLCNLNEAYQLFKSKKQNIKISFSKFADLRPKECVLAGGAGTHTVCICTIHQNMKLMIVGAHLGTLTEGEQHHLSDYHQCMIAVTCNEASSNCYLGDCSTCNNLMEDFISYMEQILSKNSIDDFVYKQWLSTDRTTLQTVSQSTEEFIETFHASLQILKKHDFIAKEQSKFFSDKKSSLKAGEVLVIADFSENYSFILQDAAQGFHWNNAQATLHPFVCYYRNDKELEHINCVVISDCLKHGTVAVHLFQRKLIKLLKENLDFDIQKLIYFSDGAVTQYKNFKNFINLCNHKSEFGIDAEWHFFATSHGKGPCDGLGGTIKRLAAKASLQRPYNEQIMTPRQLFVYARENISGINILYSSTDEWTNEAEILENRFDNASTIIGTQKLHSFIPLSQGKMEVKTVSTQNEGKIVQITKQNNTEFEDIKGFVTAIYDRNWWLGCVLDKYPDNGEVKLTFLQPKGPSPSFCYPSHPDISILKYSDILSLVDPITDTGRTYKLSKSEMDNASKNLKKRIFGKKFK